MDADFRPFLVGKPVKYPVVKRDEIIEYAATWIEFEGQPALGEIELHDVCPRVQAAADVRLRLVGEVVEELLARIAVEPAGRVEQAERGRRDHRLLHGHARVTECGAKVVRGVRGV